MRVDPELAAAIPTDRLANWLVDSAVICGIWADGRLAFFNAAWDRFASENGEPAITRTWPIGRSIWEAVPNELQAFYRTGFADSLAHSRPFQHDYECSSPTHRRTFHMTAAPIADGVALLLVHSLRREELHVDRVDAAASAYVDRHGLVHQCVHCRRVRVPDGGDRWDFVPAFVVRQQTKISHGLCGPCFELHYPHRPRVPSSK